MSIGKLLKAAIKFAPILVPAAPVIVAGAKAVIRSQKKGGSLNDELPAIMAGVAAGKMVADSFKRSKTNAAN